MESERKKVKIRHGEGESEVVEEESGKKVNHRTGGLCVMAERTAGR